MICVHCGLALGESIGAGLYTHVNNRQRCQSDPVPYGHMGHPDMPCPRVPDSPNPCSGSLEPACDHLHSERTS